METEDHIGIILRQLVLLGTGLMSGTLTPVLVRLPKSRTTPFGTFTKG